MRSLALYIDKWYIIGAICADGIVRPVNLPNGEDRIWLFFHEDIANDTVSYGKGFKSHYWNRENHYYGDIFTTITDSVSKFTMFKHAQPIKDIFKMGKVFDDLKTAFGTESDIPTYLSFSKDISPAARLIFKNELKAEHFHVNESVARIDHLALEHAVKHNDFTNEGIYIVLNACNENLHYSAYKRSGEIFLRLSEDTMPGWGADLRTRCLIEQVVDCINHTERILQSTEEKEAEYLRCLQYAEDWMRKVSCTSHNVPTQITDITFSKDPHKTYSVTVSRKQIDDKTSVITKNLVDEIERFFRENGIHNEEVSGIFLLGNTFTNQQFVSQLKQHYNLHDCQMICFPETDLSMIVSTYSVMDCGQFKEQEATFTANAEDELLRLRMAEEERIANEKAAADAEAKAKVTQAQREEEKKFLQAMEMGYESESKHDYENMVEYFEIAKNLRPDNDEAVAKYTEALRLNTEKSVLLKTYKEKLQQAKSALDLKDWEHAKQKAEEALSSNPESKEARQIKDEADRQTIRQKEFERYIDRSDLFIAKKLYAEAHGELEKARLLTVDNKAVQARLTKIREEQEAFKVKVDNLVDRLNTAIRIKDYDEAKIICNELLEEDSTNHNKWSNKLTEINLLAQGEKERTEKVRVLLSEIDTAQWKDDWSMVVEKCKMLLAINPKDEGVQAKMAVAKEKIRMMEERAVVEKTFADINDLIVRAEFKEAKEKLNSLKQRCGNDAETDRKIRDLWKLLFERESEFESKKNTTPKPFRPDRTNFFDENVHETKDPKLKSANKTNQETSDFFGDTATEKRNTTRKPNPKPIKGGDDFFDS